MFSSKTLVKKYRLSHNVSFLVNLNNSFFHCKKPKCLYSTFPTQARVVIAGAGTVANSVAYHLAQSGWTDVVMLEQNQIGSGTSRFGSGTLGLFKPIAHRNLIMYSIKLYKKLQEMGYDIGLKQCGSVYLAQTKDRMLALKRRMAYNIPTGLECELMDGDMLKKLHPFLQVDDLEGGVWVPQDGVVDPKSVCNVLALLAQQAGIRYFENTCISTVLTKNRTVDEVVTSRGNIKCEFFVNCAGMWSRELGLCSTPPVQIPAYPVAHYYATTGPLQEIVDESIPIVRDFDSNTYIREYDGGFMVGWFDNEAQPVFEDHNTIPVDWITHLKLNMEKLNSLWGSAKNRIPALTQCVQPEYVNSPDNFTPDGRWILGETAEVTKYFVACGMNGNSLQGAGGIGKAVAEWIIEGKPTQDLLPFTVQRFLNIHNSRPYLKQRVREVVGRHYAILYPHQCEYKYSRNLRCSPLYSVLEDRGAVFGIKMAYERALYFDSTYKKGQPKPCMPQGTFYKPKFFDFMKEEYMACRESVGIIDMSSFSKIEIKGNGSDALNYLQIVCSNDVDIPLGTVVRTGMQNDRGGYENDCMMVRQTETDFFMVSPTSQQTRIYEWMNRNLPTKSSIVLNDVTSMYTVINVVGPKAPDLLKELSNSDLNLPSFCYKKVNLGYASDVMVMSFTHTGESGYCLYIPSEYALHVYFQLMEVGLDYGVRDVGTLTQRFMRIERFIPFWAEELSSFTTPFEAGNTYTVRLDKKEDFIGKQALRKQKEKGVFKQLVMFHLKNLDPEVDIWPWGGEPIYRNGLFVGNVTSAGYAFSSDKLICIGYMRRSDNNEGIPLTTDYILNKESTYEIDIAGHRFLATPYIHAPALAPRSKNSNYRPTVTRYTSDIST
ncbi:hypothetical protein HHI36_023048 [Cryptolaemus montrouzieri]|uniref:Pyruvate dehydrogenase phosphatase regulatory subunit, mitochondrial n=1 Tax=Cryptolaemus montrouzieri TaxID=559131 RepID=A0ABD2PF59_9CUCU